MRSLSKRRWLWASLFLSTAVLVGCGEQQSTQQRPATLVDTITLTPATAVIRADLPGRVDAVRHAEVRARVTGIVQEILFEQGSEVVRNQSLFKIDPAPYQAAFDQARADLLRAQADEKAAIALSKRYAPLVKINAVSRQEYDDAVARADQARANVLAAQAALASAEINLAYTHVTSPIDGRIGEALVTEGALVEATTATQMALVQQMSPIYVDVYQSVTELSKLRRDFKDGKLKQVSNEAAEVSVILQDGSIYPGKARLLFTGTTVNETTGQVVLRTEVDNQDAALLPGMYVRVRVEQAVSEQALLVPPQALQRAANGLTNVYVVRDGKAVLAPVEVGNDYDNQVIITQGLKSGDEVIVAGFQKIREGAAVQTRPWQPDR
ncbi:efflux RND transporter periplasmic adaptor subunit [Orrella daihaiensis]|uniref:Efflux RND transporter periplasmic adaptor subunit n=1 Tax=Orrella daihaiensis TaxID=2782176 RepID=A0ABY4AP88_9BURK|nr:efflux RND transporter periplasmic adaptor subunit [Orrella daihaiensis]UOD51200.1 efflux RND transporter periplasmic adaptor subunit [Orrella daihaiensis]